jgi:hypothetical protein
MPSISELPPWLRITGRALLYAVAITLLVIFLPSGDHVFIYQEF